MEGVGQGEARVESTNKSLDVKCAWHEKVLASETSTICASCSDMVVSKFREEARAQGLKVLNYVHSSRRVN